MSPENWQMQPLAVKIDTPAGTSPCAGGKCDGARGERTQDHRVHRRSYAGRARLRLSIRLQGSLGRSQRRYQAVRQPWSRSPRTLTCWFHEGQARISSSLFRKRRNILVMRASPKSWPTSVAITRRRSAATEANEAGVQLLVLSHIGPPTPKRASREIAFHCAASRTSGRTGDSRLRRIATDDAGRLENIETSTVGSSFNSRWIELRHDCKI